MTKLEGMEFDDQETGMQKEKRRAMALVSTLGRKGSAIDEIEIKPEKYTKSRSNPGNETLTKFSGESRTLDEIQDYSTYGNSILSHKTNNTRRRSRNNMDCMNFRHF